MKTPQLSADQRAKLETVIGHAFSDKQWLDRALTHASTGTAKSGCEKAHQDRDDGDNDEDLHQGDPAVARNGRCVARRRRHRGKGGLVGGHREQLHPGSSRQRHHPH